MERERGNRYGIKRCGHTHNCLTLAGVLGRLYFLVIQEFEKFEGRRISRNFTFEIH